MRQSLLAALIVIAGACRPLVPGPVPPNVDGGAGDCGAACANLARMQCPGAEGSAGADEVYGNDDDVSCAQACRGVEAAGVATMATGCVAVATTCKMADDCLAASTP